LSIRKDQPEAMSGTAVKVPVLEAGSKARIGRFGWKGQHASLESFSADAYLNEMGITTPLFPEENTSNDRFVGYGSDYDPVPDPEDDGVDVVAFANFMRATKAPPRGPVNDDVLAGDALFNEIGCAICHTPSITTAPPGTKINGGAFTVPDALGNKFFILTAIFCCTTSARETAYRFCRCRNMRRPRIRCAPRPCGGLGLVIDSCMTACP
jgi:hypothetical protein